MPFMDPAVTAAIITTPTAVIAAAAAYAAGRAQARGAHRGPVDAVRRQHQRDAYAEFLRAALSYQNSTQQVMHLVEQVHRARLSDEVVVRRRLGAVVGRRGFRRVDLADALAPEGLPPAVDHVLEEFEEWRPNWQQDIDDANNTEDLERADSVVMLEGPDHLAQLAREVMYQVAQVRSCWGRAAWAPFVPILQLEEMEQGAPRDMHARLEAAIDEFTRAARAFLNT
jgi:hypothetical protein